MTRDIFQPWLARWRLTRDGEGFATAFHSHLLPVIHDGAPAMLKIALNQEEREGARLMVWYGGTGAARVLAHDGAVLLMARAVGARSLRVMATSGQDDAACAILCDAVERLHAPRPQPPPAMLAPLPVWFRQLGPAAAAHGGVLVKSAQAARELLATPREARVLHGDVHHDNILDGGPRGWLAIDPKGLHGERGFDYGNLFCNPDIETAAAPGRLARRAALVARTAAIEPRRLLLWVLAYAGLSAAWTLGDGGDPVLALTIAQIAAAELATG
ncbi:MAG: aminoglycoside phosphotransferase family protein [Caulobacteraceae bacterium]